ncbi:MAG: NAD(P)/FAD-dependent oxidoreductase [Syntrophobacterales bacterium]|jgi:all-trans-retinol 13,14-reductase|nr:NAD(P)/FAD-dependent oxidoreductase [Syntrophobacterales bacterium]
MKYDCAVIGAGVSGMTAALIMAQKGYRTALLEASHKTAPTIRGFRRCGLFFDTGFHYTGGLNDGEPLDVFFRFLGLSGKIETYPLNENGFDIFRCLNPSFEFSFPSGYDRISERLKGVFPKDTQAVDAYLQEVRRIYHSQLYLDLDVSADVAGLATASAGLSLREFLDGVTDNEMLKCVLSMHCLLHGVMPEEVSFTSHACVAGSYYESARGIKGGGLSLAEAFDARLEETGVELFCGTEVTDILLSEERSVKGLRFCDGHILECGICISTIHPLQFLRLVPPSEFRPVYRRRLETLEDTCSAVIVYVESDVPLESLDRRNMLLFPVPCFPDTERDLPVEGKPFFIARAPQEHQGSAKEGYIIICPVPNMGRDSRPAGLYSDDPETYRSYKESVSTKILEHIESSCPEFKGKMTQVDCATPRTLKRYTHSPVGSIYGVKHGINQPSPLPVTKIKNLFLAGQAVTAPGILGAAVSGFLACGSVLGHDRIMEELKGWA